MLCFLLQVLLLWLTCADQCQPTTLVSFSPMGYSPNVAPGFAYAFRAPVPVAAANAGRSLVTAGPLSAPLTNIVTLNTADTPTVYKTQYHSQDELGQYAFGYVGDSSTAHEVRTMDGAVRGSYTYLDSDGNLQTASYVADRQGFRVKATNLPQMPDVPPPAEVSLPQPVQPTPEVEAATYAHLRAVEEVKAATLARNRRAAPSLSFPSLSLVEEKIN